jgi:hypothetical protein
VTGSYGLRKLQTYGACATIMPWRRSKVHISQRVRAQIIIVALVGAVMVPVVGSAKNLHETTGTAGSHRVASASKRRRAVPPVLESALTQVKGKSIIPVLLPSVLPGDIETVRHVLVAKATSREYEISMYYKLGVGDAGFAGLFSAQANPGYTPQELPNVREVELAHGIHGYFRAVSCGGSCAPANLWWNEGHTLYQIQLVLPSDYSDFIQKHDMVMTADSAILAGPR